MSTSPRGSQPPSQPPKGARVGYDLPATPGMALRDVSTPALIVDLDQLEANIKRLGDYIKARGIRHRAHAKTHK